MIQLFGIEWYNALNPYLDEKSLAHLFKIGNLIASQRVTKKIYPPSNLVFRAFKETPYQDVKVILLGRNPYSNYPNEADGLSFSASMALYAPKDVKLILEEIDLEYPEWKDSIEYGRLGGVDLKRWANQGVFLYNTYLTVIHREPNSHNYLWFPFTQIVFKALCDKNDLVWIILGNKTKKFIKFITNPTHSILTAPYPTDKDFLGCNVFRKANEELQARNKKIIYW